MDPVVPDATSGQYLRHYYLQANRHAGKEMEDCTVDLERGQGHELFEHLSENSTIALKACAAFPGWLNHVESARVQLWKADYQRSPLEKKP